jgi:hypothetical protein
MLRVRRVGADRQGDIRFLDEHHRSTRPGSEDFLFARM